MLRHHLTRLLPLIFIYIFIFSCSEPVSNNSGNNDSNSKSEDTENPKSSAGFLVGKISGDTFENGTTATFSVKLTSQPEEHVIINVSSEDENEGVVSPTVLKFTSNNWDAEGHIITVTGQEDDVKDGHTSFSVILSNAISLDSNYDGLKPNDVVIINRDIESPGFIVSKISGNTGEDGTTATFNVK